VGVRRLPHNRASGQPQQEDIVKLPTSIRLTYSNVVATVALFAALGGSAYALGPSFVGPGGAIQGCVTKNSGVLKVVKPGKRCAHGARSVLFNAHGTVAQATSATYAAHARSADSATTATTAAHALSATNAATAMTAADANTVGGITVRKIFYAPAAATTTPTTILSLGGLTLNAICDQGILAVTVKSAVDHTHFESEMYNSAGADGFHHTDYNAANGEDLTDQNLWGETSFTYTKPDGTIVNGQVSFDSAAANGGDIFNHSAQCLVSGFAMSTASS
jgi:hypothetical protein